MQGFVIINGFLKIGILEENCFNGYFGLNSFFVKINDHIINEDNYISFLSINRSLYESIKLSDELDELFYSFHNYISLLFPNDEFPNIIYPIFLGINYNSY